LQIETPVVAADSVVMLHNIGSSLMRVCTTVPQVSDVAAIFIDHSLSISLHLLSMQTDVHHLLSLVYRVIDKHKVVSTSIVAMLLF